MGNVGPVGLVAVNSSSRCRGPGAGEEDAGQVTTLLLLLLPRSSWSYVECWGLWPKAMMSGLTAHVLLEVFHCGIYCLSNYAAYGPSPRGLGDNGLIWSF